MAITVEKRHLVTPSYRHRPTAQSDGVCNDANRCYFSLLKKKKNSFYRKGESRMPRARQRRLFRNSIETFSAIVVKMSPIQLHYWQYTQNVLYKWHNLTVEFKKTRRKQFRFDQLS